jgi:hypothetical protein
MRCPLQREKETPMDIPIFALVFIAVIYPVVILIKCHPIAYLGGIYRRRTKVMHTSTQLRQIHFALKEGQTIVGVRDTTKAMCFYIGADVMDEKNYE